MQGCNPRSQGPTKGAEYFAGYILEQSLSVDNLFVFILVFKYFRVPRVDQDKARCSPLRTTAKRCLGFRCHLAQLSHHQPESCGLCSTILEPDAIYEADPVQRRSQFRPASLCLTAGRRMTADVAAWRRC